jgi:hypothetical protein
MAKSIFPARNADRDYLTKIGFFFRRTPGSTSYTPAQGAYNYGTPQQRAPGYPDQTGYAAPSQTYQPGNSSAFPLSVFVANAPDF